MSEVVETDDVPLGAIRDFETLYARQNGFNSWLVLHLREGGENTAYQVNLSDISCDCQDMAYNQSDPGVCKHIAYAAFQADRTYPVDEEALRNTADLIGDLKEAADRLTRAATGAEVDRAVDGDGSAETGSSADSDDGEDDPVVRLERALEDAGVDPANVDVWIDDQYGSLQFTADGMDDDEFDVFREWCQDCSFVNWDRDERRNYVKSDDFGRL